MSFNPNVTPTLSLLELVIGITCTVGLICAVLLAYDYLRDLLDDATEPDVRLAAIVGLRNAVALTLVNALFAFFVIVAGATPPAVRPVNQFATYLEALIFELIVIILAATSALNLRDKRRLRRGLH